MSMEYIRRTYGVPAKRGGRVRYTDPGGVTWTGRITAARGAHLLVLVDDRVPGYRKRLKLHPTWNVTYEPDSNAGVPRPVTAQEDRWLHDAAKRSGTVVAPGKLADEAGVDLPDGSRNG